MNAAPDRYHDATASLDFNRSVTGPDTANLRRLELRQLGELDVDWHLAMLESRPDLADEFAEKIQHLERKLGFR